MSNTERLERMAAELDGNAVAWRQSAQRHRAHGHADEAGMCDRMAAHSERDAAWYRSLIPLVEAGERAQWQPIESAPKDGSVVLLHRAETNSPFFYMVLGFWSCKRGCWWSQSRYQIGNPTHWQPLPAPPKEGA